MRCDGTNGLTLRACDQAIRLRLKKTYCLAAVLLSFTSRSDEYAAAPATMILAAMTGLEWIITPYVIQKRAATDWIQRSFAGSFEKYEIVNTAVAIQPTPSSINTPVPFPIKLLLRLFESLQYSFYTCIQHYRRALLLLQNCSIIFLIWKQISAMKLNGEIRILQHVPGQDEHDRLIAFDEALLH